MEVNVRIRGKVKFISNGKVVTEVENTVHLNELTQVVYNAMTNSITQGTQAQQYVVLTFSGGIKSSVPVTFNNFVWSGTLTLSVESTIVQLDLFPSFNANPFLASTVQTNITLPPGTYTIEWIWDIDDPVGLVREILYLGFNNAYSSFKVVAGKCTNLASVTKYKNTITLWFACLQSTSSTFTTFYDTFAETSKSNTTYYFTTYLNFAYQFELNAPNALIVPLTITIT